MVEAGQAVVEKTTKAEQEQRVAVTLADAEADRRGGPQLEAARTRLRPFSPIAEADAEVIKLDNAAEAAGLEAQVLAFEGDGAAMARNLLLGKLPPAFRTILSNSEGPLMDLFRQFTQRPELPRSLPAAASSSRPVSLTRRPSIVLPLAPASDRVGESSAQPSRPVADASEENQR